jgi:hypothetical protein
LGGGTIFCKAMLCWLSLKSKIHVSVTEYSALRAEFDKVFGLGHGCEPVRVEAFRPQGSIERFHERIVGRLPGKLTLALA